MWVVKTLYTTVIEALFPLSSAEKGLLSFSPESALTSLPQAPKSPIENTYSVFAYKDERVEKLVWNIKYKKLPSSIAIGGHALYQKLIELNLDGELIVIPIPITPRRRRERGFNQCELLVDEIGRLDTKDKFHIDKELLIRVQHASRQTLKSRSDRLESAKGIFSVDESLLKELLAKDSAIKNSEIVIIDDVITTGSTMKEAIETLKSSGFEKVTGLSLAH